MAYDKKQIRLKKNKQSITYYGTLTVSGTGDVQIPCRGKPYEIEVCFSDPTPPPQQGCGTVYNDIVDIEIDHFAEPFPLWAIKLSWDINSASTREISWKAIVFQGGQKKG